MSGFQPQAKYNFFFLNYVFVPLTDFTKLDRCLMVLSELASTGSHFSPFVLFLKVYFIVCLIQILFFSPFFWQNRTILTRQSQPHSTLTQLKRVKIINSTPIKETTKQRWHWKLKCILLLLHGRKLVICEYAWKKLEKVLVFAWNIHRRITNQPP